MNINEKLKTITFETKYDEEFEQIFENENKFNLRIKDEAQRYLNNTDYIIIQYVEGVTNRTEKEIEKIKKKRESAREVIRKE